MVLLVGKTIKEPVEVNWENGFIQVSESKHEGKDCVYIQIFHENHNRAFIRFIGEKCEGLVTEEDFTMTNKGCF